MRVYLKCVLKLLVHFLQRFYECLHSVGVLEIQLVGPCVSEFSQG